MRGENEIRRLVMNGLVMVNRVPMIPMLGVE